MSDLNIYAVHISEDSSQHYKIHLKPFIAILLPKHNWYCINTLDFQWTSRLFFFICGAQGFFNFKILAEIGTGCLKKNALIENRFKDTKYEAKLPWKSCFSSKWPWLWHGKCISILAWVFCGRFMDVFKLFHGSSRVFKDYFKSVLMWLFSMKQLSQGYSENASVHLSLHG